MNDKSSLVGEKVVVRYLNGSLVKGYTFDFSPRARGFHLFPDRKATADPRPIHVPDLKAVFSVRTFEGDPRYSERKTFLLHSASGWQRVEVTFRDGEVLVGTVRRLSSENQNFFLTPADPASNNLRVFVVATAVARLRPLTESGAPEEARGTRTRQPAAPRAGGVTLPRRFVRWLNTRATSGSVR